MGPDRFGTNSTELTLHDLLAVCLRRRLLTRQTLKLSGSGRLARVGNLDSAAANFTKNAGPKYEVDIAAATNEGGHAVPPIECRAAPVLIGMGIVAVVALGCWLLGVPVR